MNPSLLFSPTKPKLLFTEKFCITSPTCQTIFKRSHFSSCPSSSLMPRIVIVRCSNSEQSEAGSIKDALYDMVGERVEELLNREENRVLFDDLEKASQRVEMAKKELAEIERQEIEAKKLRAYIDHLESRVFEIAECQKEILEARAMVEEAQRSLSFNVDGTGVEDTSLEEESKDTEIDRNKEREESLKAALISALVGTLAGVPISFTQVNSGPQLILPLGITFISCALFGVTFRYTIRRDLDNVQLKTGTSAAFALVKGLGTLSSGPPLELNAGSFLSHAFDGAVNVSESLLIFVFAAVGLDFCFKMDLLSPFPMKRSASTNNSK